MPKQTIFDMPFTKVYPMLILKVEKKGRTKEEVLEVTSWLTGYSADEIEAFLSSNISYSTFLTDAPSWNSRSDLITGKICGIKVETIEDPLMKKVRQLDKLIDELAKGKTLEKIKR